MSRATPKPVQAARPMAPAPVARAAKTTKSIKASRPPEKTTRARPAKLAPQDGPTRRSPVEPPPRKKRPARPAWLDADGEAQGAQARDLLFRTAARAFNELGYHATTLDEVARRLNVTKPALYYYVKDKDDILFECNRLAFDLLGTALSEADAKPRTGRERLEEFLRRYAVLMTTDFGACLIRIGMRPLRPESRARLRGYANHLDKALRRMVEQGIADGSVRPCNAKLVSFAMFGAFNGIAGWYRPDGEASAAQVGTELLELFLRGLVPSR